MKHNQPVTPSSRWIAFGFAVLFGAIYVGSRGASSSTAAGAAFHCEKNPRGLNTGRMCFVVAATCE